MFKLTMEQNGMYSSAQQHTELVI